MEQHPNAKLTPKGRETLVSRIESGLGVAEAARQMGNQPPDRRQMAAQEQVRRGALRPKQPPAKAGEAHAARSRGAGLRGPLLDAARPARVGGHDGRAGAHVREDRLQAGHAEARRRRPRDPGRRAAAARSPPVRYERERPGELLHVDVKKVARIPDGGGHRALGRGCGSARGAGAACLHVAVDDFSRVAYAELLPDERKGTCAAFMSRCLRFFEGHGRAGRARDDRQRPGLPQRRVQRAARIRGARHVYTRAYSPWQDGKVERMNRTLAQEWQYARAWDGEAGRASALPAFISYYNWERPHSVVRGLPPPMSRIVGVNNLSAHNI